MCLLHGTSRFLKIGTIIWVLKLVWDTAARSDGNESSDPTTRTAGSSEFQTELVTGTGSISMKSDMGISIMNRNRIGGPSSALGPRDARASVIGAGGFRPTEINPPRTKSSLPGSENLSMYRSRVKRDSTQLTEVNHRGKTSAKCRTKM